MVSAPAPPVNKPDLVWEDRIKHEDPDPTKIRIVLPDSIFRGRTYSDLISDWFNWLLAADPDKHNSGSVVFLRAVEIPSAGVSASTSPDKTSDVSVSNAYADDTNFPRRYPNNPNVMVGGDRLEIYTDQAVFVPIIVAYIEASKPYVDWGLMQEYTGLIIDNGDNPPNEDQLTIDGNNVITTKDKMALFRIASPIFTAVVPETDYGRSAKDFLEMSFPPGHYPVMVEGYFALIKFGAGTYQLHSRAGSGRETQGHYFAELLYEINVTDKNKRKKNSTRPPRNEALISMKLRDKIKNGEVDYTTAKEIGRKAGVTLHKP